MYKFILSFRYLLNKRVSYLAFLAVAICVFIVVVVITVMTGLTGEFRQANHSFAGDCIVGTESLVGFAYYDEFANMLEKADFIYAVSPLIKSYALISPDETDRSVGVEIMGIDAAKHSMATGFGRTLHYRKENTAKAFEPLYDPNLTGCVVGIDLWLQRDARGRYFYGITPTKTALVISCFPLSAKGALSNAGTSLVNTKTFYYSDTSHSGLARVDGSTIYVPFEQAQMLCGMDGPDKRASAICVTFKPSVKLTSGCKRVYSMWREFVQQKKGEQLADLLDGVSVQSWESYRRTFIAAMEKERTVLIMMFTLMGITTVFIVFVVLYMVVGSKSKDIGILKSVGVSNIDVIELFSGYAFLIGISGSIFGMAGGWVFLRKINGIESWLFEHFGFQLWDRTIYAIEDIPNQVDFKVLSVIMFSAVVACLAGAVVPSWRAAGLEPVETLQVSQL